MQNWYSSKDYYVPSTIVIILYLLCYLTLNYIKEGYTVFNLEVKKNKGYSDKIILLKVQLISKETRIQTKLVFISLPEAGHLEKIHQSLIY